MGCGSSSLSNGSDLSPSSAPLTILVIGLDNSGKTTLSHTINNDIDPIIVPTVGFNAPVRRRISGHPVTFFDLGGGSRIRGVWPQYFADVHGVVFVVDAADSARFEEAKAELHSALVHPMVVGKPLLVLANKEDLPSAQPAKLLGEALELEKAAVLCRHNIVGCSAKPVTSVTAATSSSSSTTTLPTTKPSIEASTSQGLQSLDSRIGVGLEWLIDAIRNDWDKLEERRKREQIEHKKLEDFARKERLRKIQEETAAATSAAAAAASSSSSTSAAEKTASSATSEGPQCKLCKASPAVRRCAAAGWEAVCDPCGNKAESDAAADASSSSASSSSEQVVTTPLSPINAVTVVNESNEEEDQELEATEHGPSTPHPSSPHAPLKSAISSHDVIGTPINKHAHFDALAETPLPNQIDNNPISPAQTDVVVIPSAAPSTVKETPSAAATAADETTNQSQINDDENSSTMQDTPLQSPIRGLALSPVFDEAAASVVSALPEISSPATVVNNAATESAAYSPPASAVETNEDPTSSS